jgi:uncharacterized damage-inducible protein DinB
VTEMDLLLTQLDQAFDRKSWHGTNLRGSVRGMPETVAAWRPAPRRHSIQEIVIHAAYWKYVVRRRLTGEKRGGFPLEGSDWFPRPAADTSQWRDDLRLLDGQHRLLRETVAALDPRTLQKPVSGSVTPLFLVSGIIAHDLYHAGQIQLLKRMERDR